MSYTLSSLQRQVWASQLRYPGAALQNMATLTHLDGAIDPQRFTDAFAAVVQASDVLRSRVGPVLTIHKTPPATTLVIKIARKDAATWADQRNRTPLNMARAGYDSVLLMHGDGTASWYLGLHHMVTDATSSALVFDATAKAYAGKPVQQHCFYDRLPATNAPHDHAGKRAAAHWKARQPATPLGDIYLTSTRKGPASQQADILVNSDMPALLSACLSGPYQMLSEGLARTSIMVTASALFLHRLTGKHAFSIGLPVHLRGNDTASLIGPLMEMFPVDITIKPEDTHLTLFQRTSESVLLTVMNAAPQTSPPSDYAMVVNVIPPNAAPTTFGDIPAQMAWRHAGMVDPDHALRLHVTPYANSTGDQAGLNLKLDMNATLIPKPARTRMPGYFAAVLQGVLESPDAPIGARDICGADELAKIQGWEHSKGFTNTSLTPTQLKTALKGNDALVIDGPAGRLTGDQLWRKATHFAGGLQRAGVGKGCRIGISLPPSPEAVIAIYGTMLAGASFVPLDPAQPATRRAMLAKSAGIKQVFSTAKAVAECKGAFSPVKTSSTDEAYLMFTSGSSGAPKPVPITHSGLAHYLRFALHSYFGMAKPAIAPLFGSLTFDLSITTLFAPILSGGRIIPVGQGGPAALAAIAENTSINWLKATPSHLEILTRMLPKNHGLKTVVVGGEAFRHRLALDLGKINKDINVYNEYGPTETVVGCMIHKVDFAKEEGPDVPIGMPAPGVTLRVVGSYGQRAPLGVSGELWISHAGMTAGYEAGPDKGAFTTQDGIRFYRSGDLARLGEDMLLTYQGRLDDEIKTGGIRLNPAEVEDALNRHPLIEKSVVRAWAPEWREPVQHCRECGLPDNVPGIGFDKNGVCDTCHDYKKVAAAAQSWFGKPDDMKAVFAAARARSSSEYDCLHMLSGGKDSTYTLCRLIDLGYKPFVFTFDNGFIPASVKENIRKVVSGLRVDHEFASTPEMNPIFRDSLATHSNVCNGCFKTLYTLASNRAEELGITLIVTGLSRGQLFETRLTPGQFRESRFDARAIDRAVVDARRVYHRLNDLPNRLLDTDIFADDTLFERIEFLDFFRYEDIALSEMLEYLHSRTKWRRPPDTGRSTNCLINVLGINTHRIEQGYHNYAVPYAWDVRLGHKTRAQAIDELADDLDKAEISELQTMLGFEPTVKKTLTAWLVLAKGALRAPTPAELRAFLADLLPAHAVPDAFVELADTPLTKNGKVNTALLPAPAITHRPVKDFPIAALSETEKTIIAIWEQALRVEPISLEDDFFALGGDSLAALEMVIEVSQACKVNLPDAAGFSNTTPQALANLVDTMRGGQGTAVPVSNPPADTRSGTTPPVLSVGERTILFDQGRDQTSKKYNVCRIFKVAGAVDAPNFEAALRKVARCHEPLNWSYGVPRKHLPVAQALSVSAAKTPSSRDAANEAIQRLHRTGFDLENGPLMRCLIQPLDDKTTLIAFAIHHVSGDHDSFDQLWQQVNNVLAGAPPPSLSVGYAGFCAWQETEMADDTPAFWLEYPPQQPANPHCIGKPAVAAPDGYLQQSCDLTPEAMRAVSGSSPVTLAIAATAAALRPFHQHDNIGFALVSSSRTHVAAAGLFGYLLNPLPIEIDCAPDSPLADLGRAAAQVAGKVLSHRGYPLAHIIADRRAQNIALPQINILLSFDDAAPAALNGKPVQQQVAFNGHAVADLGFFVELREGRVDVSLEYAGKTVSEETAATILYRFSCALSQMVKAPTTRVNQLGEAKPEPSLLIGPELHNKSLILPQILRHIAEQPTAPACTCGAESITWASLGTGAADIATRLTAKGVKRGDMVLVYLPRSVDLVCAILGVMLAGAAYVPLDPDYPEAWIDDIKARTKARYSISGAGGRILTKGDIRAENIGGQSVTPTASDVSGDDPAYVIFTSGSSGKPKGVAITHAQLAASTNARAQVYNNAPGKFALLSSVAFDSSIVGLFWTLASGGEVLLPDEAQAHDVDAITTLLGQGVTHTLCVPTLYQALLSRKSGMWPAQMIVAGEACPPALLKAHFTHAPASRLTNEYGLTEASIWSSYSHLEPTHKGVPVGQPIPGAWLAVLDSNGNICPQDTAGELVVGGAGVASGYLDSPDETAKRFGNGGAGLPVGRFYRTGDKAAIKGGAVHLTGRLDDQINLGGTRIEPSQIEQVLAGVNGVAAAIIVVRDARLVAHLEIAEGTDISGPKAAANALPARMRPAVYVPHAHLPRRPNGKIDRIACAQLPVNPPKAGVMPTETTEKLTQMFADELRVPGFTKTDNFFDHGGHSLMVINLVLAIEAQLGIHLSTSDLFTAPSPVALARLIAGQQPAPATPSHGLVIPIQPNGDLPPLFAIQNLGDDCKHIRPLSARLGPNQPVYGLGDPVQVTLLGAKVNDPSKPYEISEIAAAYVAEIERIAPTGPFALLAICGGVAVAYEIAQQLSARGRTADLFVMITDWHAPYLALDTQKMSYEIRQSRWQKFKKNKPRYLIKAPAKIANLLRNRILKIARIREIKAVEKAQRKGILLSQKLQIRAYLERAYASMHSYVYRRYSGKVLILRGDQDQGFIGAKQEAGWGDLLPDSRYIKTPGVGIVLMQEPDVEHIAQHIQTALNTVHGVGGQPTKRVKRTDDFEISLSIPDDGFIAAPTPEQRNWIINQGLREFADALNTGHARAPEMNAGGGPISVEGRALAKLDDQDIMEDWQNPVMQAMADAVCRNGGDILEIGFGRGMSSTMIQNVRVASHTIIECNRHVIEDCERWKAGYPDRDIRIINSLWEDAVDGFSADQTFDGIFFHTYPLSTDDLLESLASQATFAGNFFPAAQNLLKPGGKFSYFTNEADSLSRAHQRALLKYFDSFTISQVANLDIPPESRDAQWYFEMVIVEATAR